MDLLVGFCFGRVIDEGGFFLGRVFVRLWYVVGRLVGVGRCCVGGCGGFGGVVGGIGIGGLGGVGGVGEFMGVGGG